MSGAAGPDETETEEYTTFEAAVARHFEREPRVRVRVEVGGKTHPGSLRSNNDDQFLVVRRHRGREVLCTSAPRELLDPREDEAYSLAVADGMGGRKFGDVASLLALMTGWELGADEIKWSVKMNEREDRDFKHKAAVVFRLINRTINALARENPRMAGMGTTLTVGYSSGRELFVIHVGDSRAYLYRAGALRQLTRDHNLAQLLIDQGTATPGSGEVRATKHVLTNVLGRLDARLVVDVEHHRLDDDDVVLLCTDGLSEALTDTEIASTLGECRDPGAACEALIERSLMKGAADNVTAVVARYHFAAEVPFAERVGEP
jgi:protein phosphatase